MSEKQPSALQRILVFLFVTAVVVVGAWFVMNRGVQSGGARRAPGAGKAAAPVLVAKVVKENFALDLDAIGTVRAFESTDISANVTEVVTGISFDDGDFVRRGALLVTLSDAEERAALASAQALLAEEDREIARLKNLVVGGAAPEARLAERLTLADVAKQKILEAEAKLADRRITAPFDGWVGLRDISVGALVSPGKVIASLDQIDMVKIDFSVPETFMRSVRPGTGISARADVAPEAAFAGKVSHLDSRIDPVTRSVAARAEVPNPELQLKPGMLVMVRLVVEPKHSLAIPESALVPIGAKAYVFTVQDGLAKRQEVSTGRRKPGVVEIVSGVGEGQDVITDGLVGLQDGVAVKIAGSHAGPVPPFNPEQASSGTR